MKLSINSKITQIFLSLLISIIIATPLSISPHVVYAQNPITHSVIDLGSLGGNYTDPVAINDNGIVVGGSRTASGETHAFMWQNNSMTDLGTNGEFSIAYQVNNNNQAVGVSNSHAMLWQNGQKIDLSTVVGPNSTATGINNFGQIVGTVDVGAQHRGFLYQNGSFIYISSDLWPSGINDQGVVSGFTSDLRAVEWQDGILTYLPNIPDQTFSQALNIGNDGSIVGYSGITHASYNPILWKNDQVTELPALGGLAGAIPRDVNDSGEIVGDGWLSTSKRDAVLWQDGQVIDLGSVNGSNFSGARSINNKQQITVFGDINSDRIAQIWTLNPTLDTTPPVLNLPDSITQDATNSLGATVHYTVTATDPDNTLSEITINCSPVSGSIFPIGTTTVNCSASDPAGNMSNGSFDVVIKGASGQITDLTNLLNSFNLSGGGQNSFDVKLQNILTALSTNDTSTACGSLTAFINEVNAKSGKTLTTTQAIQLINSADQIKMVIGCQ